MNIRFSELHSLRPDQSAAAPQIVHNDPVPEGLPADSVSNKDAANARPSKRRQRRARARLLTRRSSSKADGLKQPSYRKAALDNDRADRLHAVLDRPLPSTLIVGGTRAGDFQAKAIFLEPSPAIAQAAKDVPLGSLGAMKRAQQAGDLARLAREHEVRPGPQIRSGSPTQTDLPPASMTRIVIFDAHQYDPVELGREIRRIAVPGAKVSLVGPGPVLVDPAIDNMLEGLLSRLMPLQSPGERLLRSQFGGFPLVLEERHFLLSRTATRPQLVEAKWTFPEFLAHVRSRPCVARAEHLTTLTKTGGFAPDGLLGRIDLDGAFARMRNAWGPPKKARLVRIALSGCTGFVQNA